MMHPILPLVPVLLPVFFAALCLVFRQHVRAQQLLAVVGASLGVIVALWLWHHATEDAVVTYIGNWAPPFGINFVADGLSATLVLTTAISVLAVMVYALHDINEGQIRRGFYPLALMLTAGVNGAFLTGDIFNLYVWFEVMLISAFSLLVVGRKASQIAAALPYIVLNLIKTMLFLLAVGLLYGTLGTLNMADMTLVAQDAMAYGAQPILTLVAVMLFLALAMNSGVFPLYFWLPESYPAPNTAISACFAALMTKVGIYAMIRIFTTALPLDLLHLQTLFLWVAIAAMLIPIVAAIAETSIRRILAFCLLSHIGSMLAALSLYSLTAMTGLVFYMVHHMLIMAALFMLAGLMQRLSGSGDIRRAGGLMKKAPLVAWVFLLAALALSGTPPMSGFWPKMLLVQAGLHDAHYVMVASMLISGILTLYAMLRIWNEVVWKPAATPASGFRPVPLTPLQRNILLLPPMALIAISLYLGCWPEPLMALSEAIAHQLLQPDYYVNAVLGG